MNDERDPLREAAWYLEAGHPDDAVNALQDADPTDVQAMCLRGRALIEIGRRNEAEEVARRGLANEPENLYLLELLASVQMIDDANAAEVTLRKGLAIDPENARLLRLYVFILLQQQRFEWAEKMLERVMRVAPDEEETQRVRTLFMLSASRSREALAAARDFLREYPDDAFAHYVQGLALLAGPWWRGFRHLREAARLRPQDPVIVETARVMKAWYLWPLHLTSGPVHYVVTGSCALFAFMGIFRDDSSSWYWLLASFGFLAYKWIAFFAARAAIDRRVTRALRQMYG